MKNQTIQDVAINAISHLKASDLAVLDVRTLTTITDTMIICTGRSHVHVRSIAENLISDAKKNQISYIKSEGIREGEWAIVDLADVVVHIMLPTARQFYNLEDLWEPLHSYAYSSA